MALTLRYDHWLWPMREIRLIDMIGDLVDLVAALCRAEQGDMCAAGHTHGRAGMAHRRLTLR
jgi:hypothetical protein